MISDFQLDKKWCEAILFMYLLFSSGIVTFNNSLYMKKIQQQQQQKKKSLY